MWECKWLAPQQKLNEGDKQHVCIRNQRHFAEQAVLGNSALTHLRKNGELPERKKEMGNERDVYRLQTGRKGTQDERSRHM